MKPRTSGRRPPLNFLGIFLSLRNLSCYIFSHASMQTPADHCFKVGKRGDSFLGNPTLLLSCSCPYLQRWPGYQWCLERNRWLSSRGCGMPQQDSLVCGTNPLWIFRQHLQPFQDPQEQSTGVQPYPHRCLSSPVLLLCVNEVSQVHLITRSTPFFLHGLACSFICYRNCLRDAQQPPEMLKEGKEQDGSVTVWAH